MLTQFYLISFFSKKLSKYNLNIEKYIFGDFMYKIFILEIQGKQKIRTLVLIFNLVFVL